MKYSQHTPVSTVINDLSSTRSKLEKIEILEEAKRADVRNLTKVLESACNIYKQYNNKKSLVGIDEGTERTSNSAGWRRFLDVLEKIANKEISGNKAKEILVKEINMMPIAERKIAQRVVKKDLRCGATASTFNKVWPGLIPVFNVSLCEKATEKSLQKMEYPAYAQEKVDALRCCPVNRKGDVKFYSRSGLEMQVHGELDDEVLALTGGLNAGMMLDSELVFLTEDYLELLPRQVSNGLANKAIKGTLSKEEAKRAILVVWDAVPVDHFDAGITNIPYEKRFDWLSKRMEEVRPEKISLVETRIVNNLRQANDMFKEMVDQGKEGIVLKSMSSLWEGKRLKDNIKFKAEAEEEADLRIVDLEEGEGKNLGKLGSFLCMSDDGTISVSVGGGLTDAQREEYWDENMKGEVIAVKYTNILETKDGYFTLYLPIFVEVRKDKTETDTIAKLKGG